MHALAVSLSVLVVGTCATSVAEELSPGQTLATHALALPAPDRVRALSALSSDEREAFFRSLGVAEIVALGRQSLDSLGVYHARVIREERVRGRLYGPDIVEVLVRERPHAVLLAFVAGEHRGRRALYNVELRSNEMLARESGVLGLFSMWLSLDSSLVRRYTNHTIAEVGFGAMMDVMKSDHGKVVAAGGYHRVDEGFDRRGLYCMFFMAPSGATSIYARRLRYCVDGKDFLPMKIEVFDDRGRREYVEYQNLQTRLIVNRDTFTPEGSGL